MNLCNQKVRQAVYLQLHKCTQLATLLHVNAMHSPYMFPLWLPKRQLCDFASPPYSALYGTTQRCALRGRH